MKPKLHRKARLKLDRHSGGHMLVYPERGLELNESAAAIAKLLDGTKTVPEIAAELARDTGAEVSQVEPDVVAFVDQLAKKGLLET